MSKVFFDMGISLDGFTAGLNGGPDNPLGDNGTKIHQWVYMLKSFREHLSLEGGDTGKDNDIVNETFERIGANIMGKKMFIEGEANWPEKAPFHCPVFVLTHQKREPWKRKGGTTFYFTNESIEAVLKRAKEAAGKKDIRISGGANVIRQYLEAGLVDEFNLHLAPIILGSGVPLFEKIKSDNFWFEIVDVIHSPVVTHLYYKVNKKNQEK